MDGFEKQGLNGNSSGEKKSPAGLKTFDAFPKTKASFTTPTRSGGQWTILLLCICTFFGYSELKTWWRGTENYHFSVEKGVSHELQLNLDIVVDMRCEDLRINIQDAVGDRILAGDLLTRDDTSWAAWEQRNYATRMGHEYQTLSHEDTDRLGEQEADSHVSHVLGEVRRNPRRKFPKGPRMGWGAEPDACRIYGSLEGNKVQGDFHITARGHGYHDGAPHLDHTAFNFTHMINELSFGNHYPSLMNPLDKTIAESETHYYKFQYFLSIVPTIYSRSKRSFESLAHALNNHGSSFVATNQYAATSQHGALPESPMLVPGIFFKYNIEPILLIVSEERASFMSLLLRVINTVSGVLVTGGWLYQMTSWAGDVWGRRKSRMASEGYLTGRSAD